MSSILHQRLLQESPVSENIHLNYSQGYNNNMVAYFRTADLEIHNLFTNSETGGTTSVPPQPELQPSKTENNNTFPVVDSERAGPVTFNTDTDFVNFQMMGEFGVTQLNFVFHLTQLNLCSPISLYLDLFFSHRSPHNLHIKPPFHMLIKFHLIHLCHSYVTCA